MSENRNTLILAQVARKGGVTKTTITGNLGAVLAAQGFRVVLIDADGQGSLSKLAGVKPHDAFYDLIVNDAEWRDVLKPASKKFAPDGELLVLSSSDGQLALSAWDEASQLIANRMAELRGWADFVLIDTSPAIDQVNNAWFYTADYLLLPTLCERLSIDHLRDQTLAYVRRSAAAGEAAGVKVAQVLGILPNRFNTSVIVDRANIGLLEGRHGDEYRIFDFIREGAAWKKAAQLTMSVYALSRTKPDERNIMSLDVRQAKAAIRELDPIIAEIVVKAGVEAAAVS